MSEELVFADEEIQKQEDEGYWTLLIVDDDVDVHSITRLALHDFTLFQKKLTIDSAYSAKEAIEKLKDNSYSVVLLDVVMESNSAGFEVVEFLRDTQEDHISRIIIRTGQAGEAPERFVINHYDINDYKEKTELTNDKLYTTIRTAITQYKQLLDLKNSKDEVYKLLTIDSLTTLPNRFKLQDDLKYATHQTALVLIDIDRFSLINDTHGFNIGDELLVSLSEYIKETLSSYDATIYRIDSDIFACVINTKEDEDIEKIVLFLKNNLCSRIFNIKSLELRINVTVGALKDDTQDMIQKAEMALREARRISRNRIQFYSSNLQIIQDIHNNNKWSSWIHEALQKDKIVVYYQPIMECKSQTIVKYEALVRLERDGNIYSPFAFLTAARYAGLLHQITRRVIEKSFEKFSQNDLAISINITDIDLMEQDFIPFVESIRQKYGIDSNRIVFELLEEVSISDNALANQQLHALISLGYGIAIDDFGVHCSNFGQLGTFKISAIKIDGTYIKDINQNENSKCITESIIFFANKKSIPIVAEFVHSKEIYDIVKQIGVDYVQGYYIGEPKADLISS